MPLLLVSLLLAGLLLPMVQGSPSSDEPLRIECTLRFTTEHALGLDLVVRQGHSLQGQRQLSSLVELRTHDLDSDRLNAAAAILAQANDTLELADRLLRGLQPADPAPLVAAVEGSWLFLYDNGIKVIFERLELDPGVAPDLRPLLLFQQYQDLSVDNDVDRLEVRVRTPADLTITTYGPDGTMFPNGQTYLTYEEGEFYHTFQSTPVYLDPTEVLGLGNRYAAGHLLRVEEQPAYLQPRAMLAVFALCLLLSFYLLKVRGRELLTKRGLPLPLGLFSWLVIALLFPLAFLPFHATLFMSCSFFGLLGSMLRLRQARRLEQRGGPTVKAKGRARAAKAARDGTSAGTGPDLAFYRKPGTAVSPVDQGLGSQAERSQLDGLLGGGEGSSPAALEPLDRSDLRAVPDEPGTIEDFRSPDRDLAGSESDMSAADTSADSQDKLSAMDALSARLAGGATAPGQETDGTGPDAPLPDDREPEPEEAPAAGLTPERPPSSAPAPVQPAATSRPVAGGMAERLARLDALSSKLNAGPADLGPAGDAPETSTPSTAKTDLSSLLGELEGQEVPTPAKSPPEVAAPPAEAPDQPRLEDLIEETAATPELEVTPSATPPVPEPTTGPGPPAPEAPSPSMPELDSPPGVQDSLSDRLAALEALKRRL